MLLPSLSVTPGRSDGWPSALEPHVAFWSHGTRKTTGVAVVVKKSFLAHFLPVRAEDCVEVVKGRIVCLHLSGEDGTQTLASIYLSHDKPHERVQALRRLRDHLRQRFCGLIVVAGDFNFVIDAMDRWSDLSGAPGRANEREAATLKELCTEFELLEWYQPEFTNCTAGVRSRLDRIYVNMPRAELLDRVVEAAALEFTPGYSSHCPVGFEFRVPQRRTSAQFPTRALLHDDFSSVAEEQFYDLVNRLPPSETSSCFQRLVLAKRAFLSAAARVLERASQPAATRTEDKLAVTMAFVRAAERGDLQRARGEAARYEHIRTVLGAALSSETLKGHRSLDVLKEHAVSLAHALHQERATELDSVRDEMGEHGYRNATTNLWRRIQRLNPDKCMTLNAVSNPDRTEVTTEPCEMAEKLAAHWAAVFARQPIDMDLLMEWLAAEYPEHRSAELRLPGASDMRWKLTQGHVDKSVRLSNDSAPGPDGIPYRAWRRCRAWAAVVLHDAGVALQQSDACAELSVAYPAPTGTGRRCDFNRGYLCCLGKKISGEDPDKGSYFTPPSTRPLSVVNTDNRLLANSWRCVLEPIFARWVSNWQRGFLKGRSMLRNIVDIDFESMKVSLKYNHGVLVLFDFAAAFPSISHEFMHAVLSYIGLPAVVHRVVYALYFENSCCVSVKGQVFEGFMLTSGVRQGCPLSPLLFVVCVDILLRRLHRLLIAESAQVVPRAFADDTAVVLSDVRFLTFTLEIYQEFGAISNLRLNLDKTVVIPLWWMPGEDGDENAVKTALEAARDIVLRDHPSWEDATFAWQGVYLGYTTGPGRRRATPAWDKAVKKYTSRAGRWSKVGLSLTEAACTYNTFVLPVLSFLGQLDDTPTVVYEAEEAALATMTPGPYRWRSSEDLWMLPQYGLPVPFKRIGVQHLAAKLRVANQEICDYRARSFALSTFEAENDDNGWRWSAWYRMSHVRVLQRAVREARLHGVDPDVEWEALRSASMRLGKSGRRKAERGLQKVLATKLASSQLFPTQHPEMRIRQKIGRWRLNRWVPEAHAAGRIFRNLQRLPKLVPPNVIAACWGTVWNRWCTGRRFQRSLSEGAVCRFGCSVTAHDSIEHYVHCEVLRRVVSERFYRSVNLQMPTFLLCDRCSDDDLAFVALLVFGTYRAHNQYRAQDVVADAERAMDCIVFFMRQAAARHHRCVRMLQGAPPISARDPAASVARSRTPPPNRSSARTQFVHGFQLGPWPS